MRRQAANANDRTPYTHRAIRRAINDTAGRRAGLLKIVQNDQKHANQHSVQFLVNHLHSHAVTELELSHVRFSNDGFNVLVSLFATTTTLTKIHLSNCYFGPQPERTSQLLAAIRTNNASVLTDLTIEPCFPLLRGTEILHLLVMLLLDYSKRTIRQ